MHRCWEIRMQGWHRDRTAKGKETKPIKWWLTNLLIVESNNKLNNSILLTMVPIKLQDRTQIKISQIFFKILQASRMLHRAKFKSRRASTINRTPITHPLWIQIRLCRMCTKEWCKIKQWRRRVKIRALSIWQLWVIIQISNMFNRCKLLKYTKACLKRNAKKWASKCRCPMQSFR